MDAYDIVTLSRAKGRPTALSYINSIFDDFTELHGDRMFADDAAIAAGIAELDGRPVTVIGMEKGTDTAEKVRRNFGSPHPEGYRKALRLMKQAEKFGRPIICFVDTAGAYCGIGAEERGQGSAVAANLEEMIALRVPIITVIIGEGGSGGALALSVANEVWMLENSYYSVISPEGAASIMWKDAAKVREACASLRLTAADLYGFGVCERVFEEKDGDFSRIFTQIKTALTEKFAEFDGMTGEQITAARYEKFRKLGRE